VAWLYVLRVSWGTVTAMATWDAATADLTPAHGMLAGPWAVGFWFDVPSTLRSKSNFRRFAAGSSAQQYRQLQQFEETVAWCARTARPRSWELPSTEQPLRQRPTVVFAVAARSSVDAANFSKSVVDACEGVLFATDASVLGVAAVARRGRSHRCGLAAAQLAPAAAPDVVAAAVGKLASQLVEQHQP